MDSGSTPVQSVRDYWEEIIGVDHGFAMNPMLQEWAHKVRQETMLGEAQPLPPEEANWEEYTTATGAPENSLSLNHMYYVDDLVIYTKKAGDLDIALADIEKHAADLGCKLNTRKSARFHIRQPEANDGENTSNVPTITLREKYKYLGIEKGLTIDHSCMWEKTEGECLQLCEQSESSVLVPE
uniref:Reverse transcriptase domain-containing protein n=1 Tax=Romanomermis culicivorax TaxID=13658 RepID=A0A915LBZ4_ROMCU